MTLKKKKKNHIPIMNFLSTEFGYKLVATCQLITTYRVTAYNTIHMYFSHMTYLISHVTSLNNGQSLAINWFVVSLL